MLNDKQKLFLIGLLIAFGSLLTKALVPDVIGLGWILMVLAIYLIITSYLLWRNDE